jgi:hypothetical protein
MLEAVWNSEFGLIFANVALPEWIVPLALTVALSFIVSAPRNRLAHPLYERLAQHPSPSGARYSPICRPQRLDGVTPADICRPCHAKFTGHKGWRDL